MAKFYLLEDYQSIVISDQSIIISDQSIIISDQSIIISDLISDRSIIISDQSMIISDRSIIIICKLPECNRNVANKILPITVKCLRSVAKHRIVCLCGECMFMHGECDVLYSSLSSHQNVCVC